MGDERRLGVLRLLRRLLRECTYLPDPAARTYVRQYVLLRFRSNRRPSTLPVEPRWTMIQETVARKDEGEDEDGAITNALPGDLELDSELDCPESLFNTDHLLQIARKGGFCFVSDAPNIPKDDKDFKTALAGLKILQRANNGELKPLFNVLAHTYGRKGRRRHALIKSLLQASDPDVAATGTPDDQILDEPESDGNDLFPAHIAKEWKKEGSAMTFRLADRLGKLEALLRSQSAIVLTDRVYSIQHRLLVLSIPETNVWLRPMPRRRVRNMVLHWYRSLLQRVLPPLPEAEWKRLQDLVYGRLPWEGLKKRRPTGTVRFHRDGLGADSDSLPALPSLSTSTLSSPTNANLGSALGLSTVVIPKGGKHQPHVIRSQLMRRLWARIFSQSPLMTWSSDAKRWTVKWGSPVLDLNVPAQGKQDIFSAVDHQGRRIAQ